MTNDLAAKLNQGEAIRVLQRLEFFISKKMYLEVEQVITLLETLSQENEQLKKQLEGAIVPKFKIGHGVWTLTYDCKICNDVPIKVIVGQVTFDGSEISYYLYDEIVSSSHTELISFEEVPESEVFATREDAEAAVKEGK